MGWDRSSRGRGKVGKRKKNKRESTKKMPAISTQNGTEAKVKVGLAPTAYNAFREEEKRGKQRESLAQKEGRLRPMEKRQKTKNKGASKKEFGRKSLIKASIRDGRWRTCSFQGWLGKERDWSSL